MHSIKFVQSTEIRGGDQLTRRDSSKLLLNSESWNHVTQQKQHAIAGSALTQNNIRYYINSMLPRISEIIQLGYPLINAVGHFIDRLDTKHTRLYIKHTRVDVRFVARRPHILRHSNHLL